MKYSRVTIAVLSIGLACSVKAEDKCGPAWIKPSIFQNVSASGIASKESPLLACTIINAIASTYSTTVFLSEAGDGDAVIEIFYVNEPRFQHLADAIYKRPVSLFPSRVADQWSTELTNDEVFLLRSRLRLPAKNTDAALLLTSDPYYYTYMFQGYIWGGDGFIPPRDYQIGVCARGYPKQGQSRINLSITSLGPGMDMNNGICYKNAETFFER